MHLIQIFLPTYSNQGEAFPASYFREVRDALINRFGGITVYMRSPAHGLWQPEDGKRVQDDLVIYEVMAQEVERAWWQEYKSSLEQTFQQEAIVIRLQVIELI